MSWELMLNIWQKRFLLCVFRIIEVLALLWGGRILLLRFSPRARFRPALHPIGQPHLTLLLQTARLYQWSSAHHQQTTLKSSGSVFWKPQLCTDLHIYCVCPNSWQFPQDCQKIDHHLHWELFLTAKAHSWAVLMPDPQFICCAGLTKPPHPGTFSRHLHWCGNF